MKVSDIVFEFLYDLGVDTAFMLSGGGIMHLVDSLGRSKIEYVCCHHEQAAGIAAQAYSMYKDDLGVALVTTGPGGTNALTACGAAYVDSTPVFFLSGQVKREDFASLRGVRQFGAQENDIVSMAKPVTKYATVLMEPKDVLYELEKCAHYALSGRKGPVWLDIPLDVQAAEVDKNELRHFTPDYEKHTAGIIDTAKYACDLLLNAKRPLIMIGQGVKASKGTDLVKDFASNYGVPVIASWRALDVFDSDDELFFGSPGLQAPRYSNLLLQHADVLLVLGSRLDNMITAFNEPHFAFRAKKVVVDIDKPELDKLKLTECHTLQADVADFMKALLNELKNVETLPKYSSWQEKCKKMKERFPILKEKQPATDGVNLYLVTEAISRFADATDTVVISSTSRCNTAGHIAFKHKPNQKTISSMGFGSMGFAAPSAVGAYYAANKNRVICIEGDGSLQLNIQELQTIVALKLNIKLFVFDNRGYAAITGMQDRNFDGFYVGSNEKSGLFMPNTEKIAKAYGLPYILIDNEKDIDEKVNQAMSMEGAVLVEIKGSLYFDEIPKCVSYIDETSKKRVSALLENPYPFLSENEMNEITSYLLN